MSADIERRFLDWFWGLLGRRISYAEDALKADLRINVLFGIEDVTSRCNAALLPEKEWEVKAGWVDLYDVDENGRIAVSEEDGATLKRYYGYVSWCNRHQD